MTNDYIAGFIDGEGCISCIPYPVVITGQCDRNVLELMCEFTGFGGVYHKMDATDKWRAASQWKINGVKAIEFLESIVDKLVLKKPEALLLIENKHLFERRRNTDELLAARKEIASQLKAMKR